MAEFNIDAGGIPSSGIPDFTGVSRGATPNRAFEALFSGVGDTISGVATLTDNAIKRNIETDVRQGYDALNQEAYGNVPPEVKNSTQGLQALQTAYDQGKITDTYYYGNLNSQLKALRSKYPGYDEFIDEAMQGITGVRPANAFRNALLSEIASMEQEANQATRDWDTWTRQNEAEIARLFPDYFTNPGKYDNQLVRQRVAMLKGDEAFITAENSRINYLKNQDQLTTEAATEAATTSLIQQANTFISGQSNMLGFDSGDFMARISAGATSGFTEQEYTELVGQMNVAESQLRTNLLSLMSQPLEPGSSNSYASIIGFAETNKLVDEAMSQFNVIKQMVADQNFGMAGYYTRLNDLRGQRDVATILDASPELRMYNGLAQIEPDLANVWLQESGNQQVVTSAVTPELIARIVQGKDGFNAAMDRIDTSNKTPEEKSATANSMIDVALSTITSGAATPEQVATAVSSIYAVDEDGRDVFNMVSPNEYSQLYSRMFNPSITQALTASGDTKSLQTYYEAARARLTAIPEFRAMAARIQDQEDWQKGIDVTFDPNSGRLQITAAPLTTQGPNALGANTGVRDNFSNPLFRDMTIKNANDAVNELNNVFSTMSPILDGLGVDQSMKGQVYLDIMRDLNVDVERGKQDGFFDWLEKSVAPTVKQLGDSITGGNQAAATPQDFKFDFLNDMARQGIQFDPSVAQNIEFELDGKVRNKPTSDFWNSTTSAILDDMPRGIGVIVTSGGQDASGPNRTGSHRHDVGEDGTSDTADVVLTRNGKKVTPQEDPQLYADFLRRAAYMGFEGIGHYNWGVHIGMGSRAAWGPSTTSSDLDPLFGEAIQAGWSAR